jgi:hypothetical protein
MAQLTHELTKNVLENIQMYAPLYGVTNAKTFVPIVVLVSIIKSNENINGL